jgi:type I restriction enzyme S subunit
MPKHWPLVPLEQLLTPVSRAESVEAGKTYRLLGAHWYAQGLFIKDITTGAGIQAKSLYRVQEGDFVYNRLFAWKGSFALATPVNDGCYVSNEFPCFTVNPYRLDGRFLWRLFSRTSVWDEALSESTGGTPTSRNRLKEHKFLAFKIPLPPLDEQRRIVARIEQLAAKIQEARGLRMGAAEEAELVLYNGCRQMRERLVSSGPVKSIGEVTKVTSGGTPDRATPQYWKDGTIPWVKTGELLDADIFSSEELISHEALRGSSAKLFPPGTVLIALYGQGQTRGRTGILRVAATTNQACAAIIPRPELFEGRYIQYWLRSLYFDMRRQERAGAQPNWNGAMIKAINVALPALSEQGRIVADLDILAGKVDALKKLQAETAAELDALLPSILDRAFRGEL